MNMASQFLLGKQDFTSFSKSNTDTMTNDCTITEAIWTKDDNHIVFTISANRFLRNMVRSIVGTLIDVGREKIDASQFLKIIKEKDRSSAGISVPAKALFLTRIIYPEGIIKS